MNFLYFLQAVVNTMNQHSECECDLTVYFNTDFKYPNGNDFVGRYGGTEDGHMDMSEITWKTKDTDCILQKLQNFQHSIPVFEQFERSVQGTEALFASLENLGHSEFRFGCIIYHQIQYKRKLTGLFQTGRCSSKECWHAIHSELPRI